MKEKINTQKQARDYLNNVLSNWNEFCVQHPNLSKSLSIVLKSNNRRGKKLIQHYFSDENVHHVLVDSDFTDDFEEFLKYIGRRVKQINYGFFGYMDLVIYEVI